MLKLKRVQLEGPVYGTRKVKLFQNSDLFVLPTRGENFGMVVAEALACAVPVLTTEGAPWSGIKEHKCGLRVETSIDGLSSGLEDLLSRSPDALKEMGKSGREWMLDRYGWEGISKSLNNAYTWLCYGGEKPESINTG